ncbi:tetratricopeptide (TPR) repeat protein [Pedobacter sp. UYP30]|uniref:tetratricopeptide repeat-containing sensor histidine kinase n=1 Tax=Pedobacter sp. UYP30 TaxID=1756400 RepID=UPI00339122C5
MRISFLLLCLTFFFSCSTKKKQKKITAENKAYDVAFEFRESGKSDSAFLYFNKAKEFFLLQGDSLGAGKCLVNMAIISTTNGDYFGGQELSLNAETYFNPEISAQKVFINSNFNNLGIATYKLHDYKNALRFYESAIKYADDSAKIMICLNNKARTYQAMGDFKQAISIYRGILKEMHLNRTEYARVISNLAMTKWKQDPAYNAKGKFYQALAIRKKAKDLWGLNASYAHLSDYYYTKNSDSALLYANKMYSVARQISSEDDQLQALGILIKLSPMAKEKAYFERFQRINDSLQVARSKAKNQFALIRYETEKGKAENLELQQDNAVKSYQIFKGELLLYGTIFVLFSSAIAAAFWYKRRRERLKVDAQNAIRASQLKTSKKVHDVVANGLYRVMAEMEHYESQNMEPLLDKIEALYEKSRDISYEEIGFSGGNFQEKIANMLISFAKEDTKIALVGNNQKLWENVNDNSKYEIEQVLQELMVNMRKHSAASHVALRFEQINGEINIWYTDNGIGIKNDVVFKNGLTNTGNRIKAIKGKITFDDNFIKGLKIQIVFPIS